MTVTTAPHREEAADGSRFYWFPDPVTGEERRLWSVTTALSAKHKDALKHWSAALAARRAMENLPKMLAAQRIDPCGRAYARLEPKGCGECPDCVQVWIQRFHLGETSRRAAEGSAVHNCLEHAIKHSPPDIWVWPNPAQTANLDPRLAEEYVPAKPPGEPGGTFASAIEPYLASLRAWAVEYDIRPEDFHASEMTVYNPDLGYAGTLDALLWLHGRNAKSVKLLARIRGDNLNIPVLIVVDCKTREGEGKEFYEDYPLQMAPYRAATLCMPNKSDRILHPMPDTAGAAILQIRPDGYTFEPVLSGGAELAAFLGILAVFTWTAEVGETAVQVKTFPVPEGFDAKKILAAAERAGGEDAQPLDLPTTDPADPGADSARCSSCKRSEPKRRTVTCGTKKGAGLPCMLDTRATPTSVSAPASSPTVPKTAPAPRVAGATLEAIARERRPGEALRDEDIPF